MKKLSIMAALLAASVGFLGCSSASNLGSNDGGTPGTPGSGEDGGVKIVEGGGTEGGIVQDDSGAHDSGTPNPRPQGAHLRVFVTATSYSGYSLGDGRADNYCKVAASAGELGGKWVAWISERTADAITRVTSSGPWYLVDNTTKVFANKDALATLPLVGIRINERGEPLTPGTVLVWTGTENGGTRGSTCGDWAPGGGESYGTVGNPNSVEEWTAEPSVSSCSSDYRLYCFEVE